VNTLAAHAPLDLAARIFIRAFAVGCGLLALSTGLVLLLGNTIHQIHGQFFALTAGQIDLAIYAWLGTMKILVIVLFLIPYLAIRWTLRTLRTEP